MENISIALAKLYKLHRGGQLEEALEGYLQFLKQHPKNAEALHALGMICVEQSKLDEAVHYLNQALSLQPENAALYLHLANVYKMQGDFSQAAELLEKNA